MAFRFYIVDEMYNVTGTNSQELALKYCSDGCTVIDTKDAAAGENVDKLVDFDDIEEAEQINDADDELPMESDDDEAQG